MSTLTPEYLRGACDTIPPTAEGVKSRLAEAACYAVLGRVLPVLRHDVAGSMQPMRMLLLLLERRVQSSQPDLAAIATSVVSLSALTKQAAADCMNALWWTDPMEDLHVSLRVGVDEAARLLAMELSETALTLVNAIADDTQTALQSTFRTVVMGALLAFCDQRVAGSTLEVTFQAAASDSRHSGQLQMRMRPGNGGESPVSPAGTRKPRVIDWADVRAMAESCSVNMAQGDGWLTLDLPQG